MKRAKSGHFYILLDTLTPRRRSLRLGELEARISSFSGPPRHSIASPRRTCKSYFGFSLSLILTITHWINENPNK